MPVNKGRVRLLIAALKSGEYEQGIGSLHRIRTQEDGTRKDEWCCLGVAADVASKFGCQLARDVSGFNNTEYFGEEHTASYLPREVREWYGFPGDRFPGDSNPKLLLPDGSATNAVSLNDSGILDGDIGTYKRVGFKEIAKAFKDTYVTEKKNVSE